MNQSKQFKDLVDSASVDSVFLTQNLTGQYKALGLDSSAGMSSFTVSEILLQKIKSSFEIKYNKAYADITLIRNLRKALIYETVILRQDNRKYIEILDSIRGAIRRSHDFLQLEDWKDAVAYAICYNRGFRNIGVFNLQAFRNQDPREFDTAVSIQKLIQWGCEIEWESGEINVISGLEKVAADLEKLISDIGGISVIRNIFTILVQSGVYNEQVSRYLFSASVSPDPGQIKPAIPFGYILNLASKDLTEAIRDTADQRYKEAIWKELIDKAAHILKIFDVQSYSGFEVIFQNSDSLIESAQQSIFYDTAVGILQSEPALEMEMLPFLFDQSRFDRSAFKNKMGFDIDHYLSVSKIITELVKDKNGPVYIYMSAVKKRLADKTISDGELSSILLSMAHLPGTINTGFSIFTDSHLCNVTKRPLIYISNTKFLMLDKSWCSMGFYEALTIQVKSSFDSGKQPDRQHTDRFIGMGLEQYIFHLLNDHVIQYATGEFTDINGKDAECDVLIESQNKIILIEIKKKQLTDVARSGDMASLFLDLASSLLHAQLQAGKVELLLKKTGKIELKDKTRSVKLIEWKGREILRISLTHYDFYSFHDRIFAKQCLKAFVERTFTPTAGADQKIFEAYDRLEIKSKEWTAQYEELATMDKRFSENPFFDSLFISAGQLHLLLKGINGNEAFTKNLLKTSHVTIGSKNFYLEHLQFLGLK